MKFEDEAALTAMCEAFMIAFAQGAIDDAFKVLEGHAAFPAAEWTALRETTKSQLALVAPRYGKFLGHELIESRPVGKSLVRHVHLAKLENNPLRCTVVFYRPADKWILNRFIWDDQFKLLWGPGA